MRSGCRSPGRISGWAPIWHGGHDWRRDCRHDRAHCSRVRRRACSRGTQSCQGQAAFSRSQVGIEFTRYVAGCNFVARFKHSAVFGTPLYFYQKNVLTLSDVQIGYLTAVGGIGGLLASIFYQYLCRKLPVKGLLILGTLGPSVGILAYLFYTSVPAALIVELLGGFVFGIGTLAFMQSAVISTLVPSAAFGFALLMSASNAGDTIGDILAALLVERLSMTLFDLVKLFAVASAACCLFVFVLPRRLLNHQEGKPIVSIGL